MPPSPAAGSRRTVMDVRAESNRTCRMQISVPRPRSSASFGDRRFSTFKPVVAAVLLVLIFLLKAPSFGQTAQTGALNGTVTDPSGRLVPGVTITLTNRTTGQKRTAVTQDNGKYLVGLLPPDVYQVEATRKDFKTAIVEQVKINITETATLNVQLQIGSFNETMTVQAEPMQLETSSSVLGHVTDQRMVENLPLVTRNYTQILGLSPGVSGDITDAASIGRGNVGLEYSTSGNIVNDNNFQMNGADVNDLMGSGSLSGGI